MFEYSKEYNPFTNWFVGNSRKANKMIQRHAPPGNDRKSRVANQTNKEVLTNEQLSAHLFRQELKFHHDQNMKMFNRLAEIENENNPETKNSLAITYGFRCLY